MSNELTCVIDAIKQDPHGETARNASHWLAVSVMNARDSYMKDPLGRIVKSQPIYIFGKTVIKHKDWQPLTDANHTRRLWKALCDKCEMGSGELAYKLFLNLLTQEPVDVVMGIMSDEGCRHYTGLTDEILKGF